MAAPLILGSCKTKTIDQLSLPFKAKMNEKIAMETGNFHANTCNVMFAFI
jgi:hypothetical protein